MSNGALYQERTRRIQKVIRLEPVERIPVIFQGTAFAPRYMGMSIAEFCAEPWVATDVTIAAMERLGGFDGINLLPSGRLPLTYPTIWLSRVAVPGRDLPPDSLWQLRESEVMTVADYDTIIERGWQAFRRGYLPRVADDVDELSRNLAWNAANRQGIFARFRERGFVPVAAGAVNPPFEAFCGGRSMHQFILDLHRRPDKVQAAMDAAMPDFIELAITLGLATEARGVWVAGGRGASAVVAPKLWDRLVFPYYLQLVDALVEKGITPVLHFDQDWTRDLARFREFPARRCVLNLDGATDVRKVKAVLGDHMAVMGDVPSATFAVGTPEDIYNHVRDLVELFGDTGLLLCPGCDAPINARPESMQAFVAAAREFGSFAE